MRFGRTGGRGRPPVRNDRRVRSGAHVVVPALFVFGWVATSPALALGQSHALSHAATAPCTGSRSSPSVIGHVLWVWMENESYASVLQSGDAPYQAALARGCGVATDYDAIGHPSLPNYLAATGGSTFGVADDGEPDVHPINATSLFSEVTDAHESWRTYAESMPRNCNLVTSGTYAARHNPAVYYVPLRAQCARDDVPLGPLGPGGSFVTAARNGALPNFSFVVPNICDDAHSCPVIDGDRWLAKFLPIVFSSPQYQSGSLVVMLTYDEGNVDNRVPMIVAARQVPSGTVSTAPFTHYSLLATTEVLLGLPLLRAANGARSMVAAFHLRSPS